MSKVVRAVVGIGLVVAGFFTGNPYLIAAGAGIAVSSLQPKVSIPSVSEATTARLNKTLEPEAFRKIAFGTTALGTDTRYWEAYGADQSNYDEVIALAGHEITSFDALYVEEELVSFDGSGNATGTYAGALSIKTELVGTSGSTLSGVGAGSKWVTADSESASMTGLAYMVLKWVWSQEKLPRGFPTRITPVGKGALVYDPRLDSTNGGTGSHRVDDQSTWAFTTTDSNGEPIGRNPALQILHYLLGWYVQNPDTSEWVLVHGMGIDPEDIDFASFITAANECEAEEYYADCLLSTGDNHATNLGVLEQACAGKVSDAGGLYTLRIQVDDFDGSLTEFTDDDVVGECDWRPEMPLAQSAYNQIAGQFIDPDALYQLRPLPLMRDTAYETADGEKVRTNVRLDAVQDGDQAQKLLRIRLNKSRQKGMFEAPFGWRAINVSVGQPVKLTLSRFGFDERYFRVRAKKVDPGGAVWLALETDHPDVYTGGTIATVPAIATGAGYDPASVPTPTSDEWEGEGGTIVVEDGAELPSVTITAGDTTQPTGVTGILLYTCQGSNSGPWDFQGEYPAGTERFVLSGLLADETYYVRMMYRNAFGVIDTSSALLLGPYTTGESVSTRAIGSVTQDDIDAALAFLASGNESLAGGLGVLEQVGARNHYRDPLFTMGVGDHTSNSAPVETVDGTPRTLQVAKSLETDDELDLVLAPLWPIRDGARAQIGVEVTTTGSVSDASLAVTFYDIDKAVIAGGPVEIATASTGNRAAGFLEDTDIPSGAYWAEVSITVTATGDGDATLAVSEIFAAPAAPQQSSVEAFRDPNDETVSQRLGRAILDQARAFQLDGLLYETAVSRAAVTVLQEVTANAARYQVSTTYEADNGETLSLIELLATDGESRIMLMSRLLAFVNDVSDGDKVVAMEIRNGIVHFLTEARLSEDAAFTHYTGDPEVLRICIGKHPDTGKVGVFLYDEAGDPLLAFDATDNTATLYPAMAAEGFSGAEADFLSASALDMMASGHPTTSPSLSDFETHSWATDDGPAIPYIASAKVKILADYTLTATADTFSWFYWKHELWRRHEGETSSSFTQTGDLLLRSEPQIWNVSQGTNGASGNAVSNNWPVPTQRSVAAKDTLPASGGNSGGYRYWVRIVPIAGPGGGSTPVEGFNITSPRIFELTSRYIEARQPRPGVNQIS